MSYEYEYTPFIEFRVSVYPLRELTEEEMETQPFKESEKRLQAALEKAVEDVTFPFKFHIEVEEW